MIKMAMSQEDILRTAELESATAGVEGEAGGIDAHPGLVTGARPALQAEISETQLDGSQNALQISRYSQRLSGLSRVATLSQSGSISQRVAATDDSSELPSCGV
jgi:hypothetical protein